MTVDRDALRALVDMLVDRNTSSLSVETIRARLSSAVPDLLAELDELDATMAADRREAKDALERAATRPIGGAAADGYDPALCEQIISEAREDDAKLGDDWRALPHWPSNGLWFVFTGHALGCLPMQTEERANAIARTRNNLRALANQLEAARHEVARLTKHNNEVACALGVEGEPDDAVAYAAWEARGHVEAIASLRTGRAEPCCIENCPDMATHFARHGDIP